MAKSNLLSLSSIQTQGWVTLNDTAVKHFCVTSILKGQTPLPQLQRRRNPTRASTSDRGGKAAASSGPQFVARNGLSLHGLQAEAFSHGLQKIWDLERQGEEI